MKKACFAIFLSLGILSFAFAASANQPQVGGNFIIDIDTEPPTLNPVTATDVAARVVHEYILSELLSRNVDTYKWEPSIAEKWEISPDNKVFTFYLNKEGKFHDGKPITAEDVKFSFDLIFDDKYNAASLRPYYEGIEKVQVVDAHTVKAFAKDTYFKNFEVMAQLVVVPKHVYVDTEKSVKMNKEVVGAGPYKIEKYDRGQRIIVKRFEDWVGFKYPSNKGQHNFERVTFRFVKDENIQLEMIKKGELDYIGLTAEAYAKKTEGDPWGKDVLKFKIENLAPKSYGYYGWNQRHDIFSDKNVRKALSHLFNREEINKKFRFGYSALATGPFYIASDYASKKVKPLLFDPKKAGELLKAAGWADTDKNGVLDKVIKGKKTDFRFTLLHANKDSEKYHTLYKEDLKKAGIEMEIKYLEWNSLLKLIDEQKFDVTAMAWGGGDIDPDPKQIWHSASAEKGGSNYIGYKNPKVDALIDKARLENNRDKRIKILQEVHELIADDAPYTFMFNDRFNFYANRARIKKLSDTKKYGLGRTYWWMQP